MILYIIIFTVIPWVSLEKGQSLLSIVYSCISMQLPQSVKANFILPYCMKEPLTHLVLQEILHILSLQCVH